MSSPQSQYEQQVKSKAGDTYTEEIPTPGGIRQGDGYSSFLFNLLMDRIIEEVSSLSMGYRMGQNKRISMVCYADDAAIFAEKNASSSRNGNAHDYNGKNKNRPN